MSWQKTLIIVAVVVSMVALVVASIWTGRDAPGTLAGLLGTTLGLALGADAFVVVRERRDDPNRKE